VTVTSMVLLGLLCSHAGATYVADEREWVSFDGLATAPLIFETKIPATAELADGPNGHRAVKVTVPDIERNEKACAASLPLPPLAGRFNALRLSVRGSSVTKRLEIVVRTTAGNFATEVPLEPEWRQVLIGPHNTRPWFSPDATELDLTKATQLRLCIGAWQGHRGGPHEFSLGPIDAVYSPLLAPAPPAETREAAGCPLPLQPFTVELLDLYRGRWDFLEPLGAHLSLGGPVTAYAFAGQATGQPKLAYLCCDPEFPDDPSHAVLKVAGPLAAERDAPCFRIDEPWFSCGVVAQPLGRGVWRCELHDIRLGPPTQGDQYLAALYLQVGDTLHPLWLSGGGQSATRVRLLTDRVGNVLVGDEPARVHLVGLCLGAAETRSLTLEATDYRTGERVWRDSLRISLAEASATDREVALPLDRFGVFEVRALGDGGAEATLRVCRVPAPRKIAPERSAVGINLFQQQVWWYAYQVPLMAKAGVHWLRPWLAWENTWRMQEPKPGEWDTRALDAALRRMEAHGLRYEYILFAAPDWVASPGRSSVPPVEKMDEWSAWVEKLVSRYKGRIRDWEVWNEPDLMWPEDTRHSGGHYLAMLEATWEAAKRADPSCSVQGLSHAGYEEWLDRVGALGAAPYMDVATIHTYAQPADFAAHVKRRRAILARHGMGDKPVWINEFGTTAYDFSPKYSAKYRCSEREQASVLTANYAQAFALTGGKAFWFCTYDPRDPANQSQWTWDAGIGVLYLGFLPKLSYVALAGVAQELDDRRCAGLVDVTRTLHQVSFEGPISVVWSDDPAQAASVPATAVGCAPGERLTVRDLFTNRIASGRAGKMHLDLSAGPVYVEGSRQLAAVAEVESAFTVEPETLALKPGGQGRLAVQTPAGATLGLDQPSALSVANAVPGDTSVMVVSVGANAPRGEHYLRLWAHAEAGVRGLLEPIDIARTVRVTVGEPNLIRDGSFALGNLLEWSPERTSPYVLDTEVGHAAPGSLRLDGPFDRRLVQFSLPVAPSRPLRLSCWVKAESLTDCEVTLNLALFAQDHWLNSPCLASTRPPAGAPNAVATIPSGTSDWTLVEATLPAELIPEESKTGAFYIDAKGDTSGRVWFDDLDLWQPAP
jgi:hypothetical protein